MGTNKYKKISSNEYEDVVSNPWSWFYQALYLCEAARGLYGLYILDRIREAMYCKEMIKKHNINDYNIDLDPDIDDISLLYTLDDYSIHLPSCTAIVPVYMMLMGLAIENIIKGIYIGRKIKKLDSKIINDFNLENFGVKGHNAPKLIDELEIDLAASERSLLEDATEHLVWAARYAVPAKVRNQILSKTVMDLTPVEFDEIPDTLFDLYDRFASIFESENGESPEDELIIKTSLTR